MQCSECSDRFDAAGSPGRQCPRCLLRLGLVSALADETDAPTLPRAHTAAGSSGEAPSPDLRNAGPLRIGPYEILRLLGEGGMGVVYLAEQSEPIRRRVAIKVIRLGMDTREVVARFESERQMLAMMSHPHVAKVLEAGATEEGRPYFVMDYVDGASIVDYCDEHRLALPERLNLFIQVCAGVQHAHQKGIIHRDIKPSNLLVEVQDGQPSPKVIDFGVAKATTTDTVERSLATRLGARVGTPAYMSPEQAELSPLEVDSRADIYALGVVLYELLCGCRPLDRDRLRQVSEEELRRILREEEPSPPSACLRGLGAEAEEVAHKRRTDSASLGRSLRGDLDWIVLKALEKDRARRYGSASELAIDLARHLKHESVTAGSPGVGYTLGKFVRRHRLAVASTAGVFLALVVGVIGTGLGLVGARRAEQLAQQEARTSGAISDFLIGLFEVSDPGAARGNSITAREILDAGADRIRRELETEPDVRARLLDTMGRVYRKLGLFDQAGSLLEEALETLEGLPEAEKTRLAATLRELGTLAVERGQYERGGALLERALAIWDGAAGSPDGERAATLKELAVLYYRKGDYERAEPLYQESLDLARRALGSDHPLVAWNLNDLANIYREREEYERAERLFRRSLEIHEKAYGPTHPYVANNLNNLANLFHQAGAYERALPLRRRALAIHEQVLGSEHPLVAFSLSNLALVNAKLGAYETAERQLRRVLEMRQVLLGPAHPDVAVSLYHLGGLYHDLGHYAHAESLCLEALAKTEAALGSDHQVAAIIVGRLAALYRDMGAYDRAEAHYLRALGVFEKTLEPGQSRIVGALQGLVEVYIHEQRYDEARVLLDRTVAVKRRRYDEDQAGPLRRADLASGLLSLGRLQMQGGEAEKATQSWGQAAEILAPLSDESEVVWFRHLHAVALLSLGRVEEARPLVAALLEKGWKHPDLIAHGREHGLL